MEWNHIDRQKKGRKKRGKRKHNIDKLRRPQYRFRKKKGDRLFGLAVFGARKYSAKVSEDGEE